MTQETLKEAFIAKTKYNYDNYFHYIQDDETVTAESYHDLYTKAHYLKQALQTKFAQYRYLIIATPCIKSQIRLYWAGILGGITPCLAPKTFSNTKPSREDIKKSYALLDTSTCLVAYGEDEFFSLKDKQATILETSNPYQYSSSFSPARQNLDASKRDDIALILMTSGSTGNSQLVPLTNDNLITRAMSSIEACNWKYGEVILNWMPLDHSGSLCDWHIRPLLNKMDQVVVDSKYIIANPHKFIELIEQYAVHRTWAPNFGVEIICNELRKMDSKIQKEIPLKEFLIAGERNKEETIIELSVLLQNICNAHHVIRPAYGLAETGSGVTYCRIGGSQESFKVYRFDEVEIGEKAVLNDSSKNRYLDVGKPISGCELRIVDELGAPLDNGRVGVILIKGRAVFEGYFGKVKGLGEDNTWFDTGDIGVILDQNLVVCGRQKEVLIINGRKIGLNDIEQRLSCMVDSWKPRFHVFALDKGTEDEWLGLAIESDHKDSQEELIEEITHALASEFQLTRVAYFAIPRNVIPRTSIGKLKRSALSKMYIENALKIYQIDFNIRNQPISGAARSGSRESNLVLGIIRRELKNKAISQNDSFIVAGGDSVSAIRIIYAARQENIYLSVNDLLVSKRIADIVSTYSQDNYSKPSKNVQTTKNSRQLVTSTQASMLLASSVEDASTYNYEYTDIRVYGKVDIKLFKEAWGIVFRSFDVFKTIFVFEGDRVSIQKNDNKSSDYIEFAELSRFDSSIVQKTIEKEFESFSSTSPFTRLPLKLFISSQKNNSYSIMIMYHHALLDGMSAALLLDKLNGIYESLTEGWIHSELKENISIYDSLNQIDKSLNADYWIDRVNQSKGQSSIVRGDSWSLRNNKKSELMKVVPDDVWSARFDCQKRFQSTLSTILQSAWLILLSNYINTKNPKFGLVVSGRSSFDTKADELVGMFVNTFPISATINQHTSIKVLVDEVKEQLVEVHRNDQVDFLAVLKQSNKSSSNELFDHLFVVENFDLSIIDSKETFCGGTVQSVHSCSNPDFPFSVQVFPGKRCEIKIIYSPTVFNESNIEILAESYTQILGALFKASLNDLVKDVYIQKIDLLSYLHTPPSSNIDNVIDRYKKCAAQHANRIAVQDGDTQVTYEELERYSDSFARLMHHTVSGGQVVVIQYRRSVDFVIAAIASLKAGFPYLPIDRHTVLNRVKQIHVDIKIACVISELPVSTYAKEGIDVPVIGIEHARSENNLPTVPPPLNLNNAYVIYTSGSTGDPKGVLCSMEGLNNLVDWHIKSYKLTHLDVSTMLCNVGFDASVWETWPILCSGGTLFIVSDEQMRDIHLLPSLISDHKITVSFIPTPVVNQILKVSWPSDSSLRVMLTGGDKLTHILNNYASFELYNNYGPSENAVVTTSGSVNSNLSHFCFPDIGQPIQGNQVLALNHLNNITPKYGAGELAIAGQNLLRGYLYKKELNSPLDEIDIGQIGTQKVYRTGDMGMFDLDGKIHFKGRQGGLAKVRGYRINLIEIEKSLCDIEGIENAVVYIESKESGDSIFAVVMRSSESKISSKEVRELLTQKLPAYMTPTEIIVFEEFPLNDRGKLDIKLIKQLAKTSSIESGTKSEFSHEVIDVFKKYTGDLSIQADAHVTQLPLNSIDMALIAHEISQLYGKKMTVNDLIASPSLEEFVKTLSQ